ncbi:hypothetical protein [Mycolicibacterium parafortuitum]|uniref:Pyridine nucleotide-disulfide oxidoreductase n=1 Tax=Mycolicibacterium parafortuitum TaxID=39692 RepID=A0A375YM00_MYCPF|nr:hypothetical protein [Mycolicibacterium parafortuitum]ORB29950.1 hypothetical protein BST38_12465 [Mycolicibacterium parafortuitum]SRX82165.1 hypothetical protein MPP7335_03925 [Mycolicibacterium parafortuitum]
MTISAQDLRRLLDADDASALVLIEGRTEVIDAEQKDEDAYRGALEVISRGELVTRIGSAQPSDDELAAQASTLDVSVNELGG